MIKLVLLFPLMVGFTCYELIFIIVLTIGFSRLYLKYGKNKHKSTCA